MCKVCRIISTYSNAHAKVKNWVFDVQFPGNWFGFFELYNLSYSDTSFDNFSSSFKIVKIPEFNLYMFGAIPADFF